MCPGAMRNDQHRHPGLWQLRLYLQSPLEPSRVQLQPIASRATLTWVPTAVGKRAQLLNEPPPVSLPVIANLPPNSVNYCLERR